MSEGPRFYGKYRATVLNNLDPRNQGRVMVQLADIYGLFPSSWALPAFMSAGLNSGAVALPAVGSQVWVEFEAGDADYPIWTGGFWGDSGGTFPPLALAGATPATPNIHFQTTTGVTVTLSDNPAQQVLVMTPAGQMLTMGAAGIVITNGVATIALVGPSVVINSGALTVT
ncbi:phage baseplate assembly protein V [Sphingomonas nostoxanthinifaciens]|uniref:phage baseplate assembly protein V n=1 Tax=Sphingomonas nostoxanthinifaciens TaxID=2872652 RepID=UPI001CC218E0|nr:phage baseplate assembly protein V [Sphingomonas nostoxanthinifaciens]UAK23290.1 phage baseplate assembly protein V [Sphingomonas nostoxanthinifaciens]